MSMTDSFFVYPPDSKVGTFSYDENLPPLPLPNLDKTLANYYESLRPLATESELQEAKRVIDEFKNGIGKKLDGMLQQKARNEKNWLHYWWENYAYLSGRYPLLPFCNMFGHSSLDDLIELSPNIALKLATTDIYYLIEFWKILRTERLKTVQNPGATIFSSWQFRRLFNTVRIPGEKMDVLKSYFKTEKEGACPAHIIILRKGRIFKIDININGKPISAAQLEYCISYIKAICENGTGQGVGILTCDERTSWARNREHLRALSEHNKNTLQLIEESILIVSLDLESPADTTEVCKLGLSHNYENRWADKSFSVCYYENGFIGGLCDHTAFDGVITGTASYYVYSKIQENGIDWYEADPSEKLEKPQELIFEVDEKIKQKIARLKKDQLENRDRVQIVSKAFKGFGKDYLKKVKIHPDAFVQMGLQLTYYRMHGKPCATYETATTRNYYNGRTETVRSCTTESLQWTKVMCSNTENENSKREHLRRATSKHIQLMSEAKKNSGCDRHLFGLYCTALDSNIDIPEFFTHELYNRSGGNGNYILSTSLSGYVPVGGAVAPMCLNGYGVFYNICGDEIRFYVTTYKDSMETDGTKFFNNMCENFLEMQKLYPIEDVQSKL